MKATVVGIPRPKAVCLWHNKTGQVSLSGFGQHTV